MEITTRYSMYVCVVFVALPSVEMEHALNWLLCEELEAQMSHSENATKC